MLQIWTSTKYSLTLLLRRCSIYYYYPFITIATKHFYYYEFVDFPMIGQFTLFVALMV